MVTSSDTRLRLIPAMILLTFALGCTSGDPVEPTAPDFAMLHMPRMVVTSLLDDGSIGTLRWAINTAPVGAVVKFTGKLCRRYATPAKGCKITLSPTSGALSVYQDLQILGSDDYALAVDGGGATAGVLIVYSGAVTVTNLTISGGSNESGSGGGVAVFGGTVALQGVTVRGNVGYVGGGIYNLGTLTLQNSKVSGNTGFLGGGIATQGGTVTLRNSTVSGNSANLGGGVYTTSTVTLIRSAVSGNTAVDGGGIASFGPLYASPGSSVILENSTVSRNMAELGAAGGIYSFGPLTLRKGTCINNNIAIGVGSTIPWDPINIFIGGEVTGHNCGVAQP